MLKISGGFTLIEMLIVVVIIGIITAVAVPNYRDYVMRGNRSTAKGDMLELQQWMERNYSLTNSYALLPTGGALTSASLPFNTSPRATTKINYNLSFTADPTSTAYTLQAVPANGQVNDVSCGTLTITSAGVRGATGSGGAANCWNQ